MNLSQPFRAEVERIGVAISDTFDAICAKVNALWNIEHTPEGGHKDITATSLTVTAGTDEEVAAGTATGNISADGAGPHTFGGNVIAQYGETQQVEIGSLSSAPFNYHFDGGIEFRSNTGRRWSWIANTVITENHCNLYDLSNGSLSGPVLDIEQNGTTYYVSPGISATGVLGNTNHLPIRKWTAYLSQLFLGVSAEAVGVWTPVAYAAGNFTASAGTWTVDAGDQLEYTYSVTNKVMTLRYSINATDVSNAGVTLKLAIPGSYTSAARVQLGIGVAADAGGARAVALVEVPSGATVVNLYATLAGGGFAITAADNTAVFGTITFEVQ